MKFLTLLKLRPGGASPDPQMAVMLNEATKAWIEGELATGRLDMAYNVLPNQSGYYGMGIGNAPSLEAMFQQLTTYPAYLLNDFEVYPLSDVQQAIDEVSAAFKKMMG